MLPLVTTAARAAIPRRLLPPLLVLLSALFLGLGALARPARAAAELTVGVLGLDAAGAPSAAAQVSAAAQSLTAHLRQRAAEVPGVRLLPGGKELVEVKLMFGCLDERPECLAKAGRALGADRLVYGSLRKAGGGFTVVLKQLDVSTGAVERFISESVSQRAVQRDSEIAALSQGFVKVLLGTALRGGLRVLSTPPGAEVRLDGQVVGRTPLTLSDVLAGAHAVSLALPGYDDAQRSLHLRGGAVFEVDVALQRPGQAPGQPPSAAGGPGAGRGAPAGGAGKALKVASFVLLGAAALSGGVALYTWRTYSGDADTARGALDVLQMNYPNAPPDVNAFFASQERLSSCDVPPALTAQAMGQDLTRAAYSSYMDACRHGRGYAGATTGLLATMGSLALLGVTTYIIGDRLGRQAQQDDGRQAQQDDGRPAQPGDARPGQKAAHQRWRPGYRPRLTELSPVVNAQGGGVNLSIRF